MKLKNWLKELNQLIKEHPEVLEKEVITSSDDEGNDFIPVYFTPQRCLYDRNNHEMETVEEGEFNAVCLN